jgi:hypothetical protein
MKFPLIVLAFTLHVSAQSSSQQKDRENSPEQIEQQESTEEKAPQKRRDKEQATLPRGPYKDGVYQYEWEIQEETGESP